MRENQPITIRDGRGKDEDLAFRGKKYKLLGDASTAEFRLGDPNNTNNEKTLIVHRNNSLTMPDLSLRTNKAIIDENTGEKAYTVVDLSFDRDRDQIAITHNVLFVTISHSMYYRELDKSDPKSSNQPAYHPQFTETLYDIANMDKKEIMEAFHTVTPDDRVDEYGRKPHEAKEDARINKRIETIADRLFMDAQFGDAIRTDEYGKLYLEGMTYDYQEIIIQEGEPKEDETNFYLGPDLYTLQKEKTRLLYFAPVTIKDEDYGTAVVYTYSAPHDSLASREQAHTLLHALETTTLRY